MKKEGYIVTALGMVSLSMVFCFGYNNFYLEKLYHEHWSTVGKYLGQLAFPLLLSAAVIIMGIVMICRKDEASEE